jgi:hypothetical protein
MATRDDFDPTDVPNGPTGPSADTFADQVVAAYWKFLGRGPTSGEVESHRGNPGGLPAVLSLIQSSDEAKAYAAAHAPAPPPGPNPPMNPGPGTIPGFGPGDLLKPFAETFSPAPSPAPFTFPDFVLPTGEQVLADDPGYGFRVNQGMQALTNSAAAKHQLRTGATLKNFLDFGQQLGSQEYGNAVDRRFNVYNTNRNNAFGIYGAAVDKNKLDWQHGFDTWNQDFSIWKWNHEFPARVLSDQAHLGLDAASRA